MIFETTLINGAYVIDIEPIDDHRGFFARSWCAREFEKRGLNAELAQCNISYNRSRGVLRGLHYSVPPAAEIKVVRCTAGTIYDVIVDLRQDSSSYLRWYAVELSAHNRRSVYVPKGVAHGFQALTDSSEVTYQMSEFYVPAAARTARWDDPAFGIEWPIANPSMSERDRDAALWEVK